jgi:hypothetical protein
VIGGIEVFAYFLLVLAGFFAGASGSNTGLSWLPPSGGAPRRWLSAFFEFFSAFWTRSLDKLRSLIFPVKLEGRIQRRITCITGRTKGIAFFVIPDTVLQRERIIGQLLHILEIIKPRPPFWLKVWLFFFLLINRKEGKRLLETLFEKTEEYIRKSDELTLKVHAYSEAVNEEFRKSEEKLRQTRAKHQRNSAVIVAVIFALAWIVYVFRKLKIIPL